MEGNEAAIRRVRLFRLSERTKCRSARESGVCASC